MSAQNFIYRRKKPDAKTHTPGDLLCRIKAECGGCAFINENYEMGLDRKFKAGLDRLNSAGVMKGVSVLEAHHSPRRFQYRSHAKLAVRKNSENPEERFAIGLFQPGTHSVVDLSSCPVHAEGINELIADLRVVLNASELQPYDEASGEGNVRYIAIRRAHLTGALMLTFVVTSDVKRPLKDMIQTLRRNNHKLASVHMNINAEPGNAIFGDETILLFGSAKLRESVCDLSFEISPLAFFQVNPWMAEVAYRRIEQLAGSVNPETRRPAWDLFSGVGQISMILARQGYDTLGIEMNPDSVKDAEHNAMLNDLEKGLQFICGRTEDVQQTIPPSHETPELILVNPSRKGLPPATLDFIAKALQRSKNTRLIYMSCEVDSLSRDLEMLCVKDYQFKLRQIEAFDMFPFTDNLEWLAVITH